MAILESSRPNAPSTIFHISNSHTDSLLRVPDDNIFQAFRLDLDSALGPRHLIRLTTIFVDGICELLDIDDLSLFDLGGGSRFFSGCGLIEVVLAGERGDCNIISWSPDIVVEESLKLQCIRVGVVGYVNVRAQFTFYEGHNVFEEDRIVEHRLDLGCETESWWQIIKLANEGMRE